jgi:hypothetical protein
MHMLLSVSVVEIKKNFKIAKRTCSCLCCLNLYFIFHIGTEKQKQNKGTPPLEIFIFNIGKKMGKKQIN